MGDASTLTLKQMLLDYAGAIGSVTAICPSEGAPHPHPGHGAVLTRVDLEALARFEGEGGLEASEPVTPPTNTHGPRADRNVSPADLWQIT